MPPIFLQLLCPQTLAGLRCNVQWFATRAYALEELALVIIPSSHLHTLHTAGSFPAGKAASSARKMLHLVGTPVQSSSAHRQASALTFQNAEECALARSPSFTFQETLTRVHRPAPHPSLPAEDETILHCPETTSPPHQTLANTLLGNANTATQLPRS